VRNLSKQVFLNALACPVLGWLLRNGKMVTAPVNLGQRFRLEQGQEIGRRARGLYPGGELIADVNLVSAVRKTGGALASLAPAVFEGAFVVDGMAARADILVRERGGWHLMEVKSGVNDRAEYVDDMAFTCAVAGACGLEPAAVSLVLVSRDYRLGMPDEALFVTADHTDDVLARAQEFASILSEVESLTSCPERPDAGLIFECRHCELFRECAGSGVDNHVFDLPRLSLSSFERLRELGIERIEDIPEGFRLTGSQTRVRECVLCGLPYVGRGLGPSLQEVEWPACYLDFETVMTAIPLYPEVAPYETIPTQYSVHRCSRVGEVAEHREYLADSVRDCRRELAEALLRDLGKQGSIITYSTFEKSVINALARLFPDLSEELGALRKRIVDLEAIIRREYYHPSFHGSTSIKVTLPALVPDMSYRGLRIADGDSAAAAFAYLAMGKDRYPETTRKNLLRYCQQDTLAMVKLHEKLVQVAGLD